MKKYHVFSLMLVAAMVRATVAQEAPPRGHGGHSRRPGGPGQAGDRPGGPGQAGDWQGPVAARLRHVAERALEDLKEQDPERYNELSRLKEEKPDEFHAALRELIPAYMRRQREANGERDGRSPLPGAPIFDRMRNETPKRFERLRQLHRQDQGAFEQEVRGAIREWGIPIDPHLRELEGHTRELATQYHQAADADGKVAAKAELREALGEAFEARVQSQEERIERLGEELERMREALRKRREMREQIIDRRLEYLLEDPALRW